jgi:hypothetical protein
VMPGHIGTDIIVNSRRVHGLSEPEAMTVCELAEVRADLARRGLPAVLDMDDDDVRHMIRMFSEGFRDNAPLSAAAAATIILDGVRSGAWRILVGDDARQLDAAVRADPESVYGPGGLGLATITGEGSPATAAAT